MIKNVYLILKSGNLELLLLYLKLALKYHFFNRLSKLNTEKIFGHRIKIFDYKSFYHTFREIFILNIYLFKTDNPKPFIVDCGSNIGLSVLYFKKLYPDAEIVCFEPNKELFELLEWNIRNLKYVRAYNLALSDKINKIKFYLDDTNSGIIRWSSRMKEVIVDSVRLSDYINQSIDLLKLDIEGSEYKVIKNLSESSKLKNIKEMMIECHDFRIENNKFFEIFKILNKEKFKYMVGASNFKSPYFAHKNELYNFMLYVYK